MIPRFSVDQDGACFISKDKRYSVEEFAKWSLRTPVQICMPAGGYNITGYIKDFYIFISIWMLTLIVIYVKWRENVSHLSMMIPRYA